MTHQLRALKADCQQFGQIHSQELSDSKAPEQEPGSQLGETLVAHELLGGADRGAPAIEVAGVLLQGRKLPLKRLQLRVSMRLCWDAVCLLPRICCRSGGCCGTVCRS